MIYYSQRLPLPSFSLSAPPPFPPFTISLLPILRFQFFNLSLIKILFPSFSFRKFLKRFYYFSVKINLKEEKVLVFFFFVLFTTFNWGTKRKRLFFVFFLNELKQKFSKYLKSKGKALMISRSLELVGRITLYEN